MRFLKINHNTKKEEKKKYANLEKKLILSRDIFLSISIYTNFQLFRSLL